MCVDRKLPQRLSKRCGLSVYKPPSKHWKRARFRQMKSDAVEDPSHFLEESITNLMSNSWSNSGGPKSQIRVIRRRRFPRFVFSSRSTPLLLVRTRSMSARTPGNTAAGDAETFGPVRLSS